jgi:hypothetical protein
MAKVSSTASIAMVNTATQTIEVRVLHTPAASFSRSVTPAAWKVAASVATANRFAPVCKGDYDFGIATEGDLCVSVITYRFTDN